MNELVFLKNEQALTTSLKVAEVFEKEHKNVLRDIEEIVRKMTAETASDIESSKSGFLENARVKASEMFKKSSYTVEGQIRKYPMYLMNFDGFSLLAMGFTGEKALMFKLAYIDAFNKMR